MKMMEKTTRTLAAQGGVMKQFAKFIDAADADEMEPLEKVLRHFNKSRGDDRDLVYSAFYMLTRHLASMEGEVTHEIEVLADNLGCHFKHAAWTLFRDAAVPELELLSTFLGRIHEPPPSEVMHPRKHVLAIMREFVERSDPKNVESAASLSNLSESLDAAEPMEEASPVPNKLELLWEKFLELKADKEEPLDFCLFAGDAHSEDEFKWVITGLRRRRRGEEDPEAWVKRIVTAIFRPHDSPKPLVETGELVPDPDAMEECLTAIRKAVASVKPHAEPKAQAVASGDA